MIKMYGFKHFHEASKSADTNINIQRLGVIANDLHYHVAFLLMNEWCNVSSLFCIFVYSSVFRVGRSYFLIILALIFTWGTCPALAHSSQVKGKMPGNLQKRFNKKIFACSAFRHRRPSIFIFFQFLIVLGNIYSTFLDDNQNNILRALSARFILMALIGLYKKCRLEIKLMQKNLSSGIHSGKISSQWTFSMLCPFAHIF